MHDAVRRVEGEVERVRGAFKAWAAGTEPQPVSSDQGAGEKALREAVERHGGADALLEDDAVLEDVLKNEPKAAAVPEGEEPPAYVGRRAGAGAAGGADGGGGRAWRRGAGEGRYKRWIRSAARAGLG